MWNTRCWTLNLSAVVSNPTLVAALSLVRCAQVSVEMTAATKDEAVSVEKKPRYGSGSFGIYSYHKIRTVASSEPVAKASPLG